jgi:ABC-type sugar transport system ATPase subunit
MYVTHDQIEAMALGDKIAIMNLGVLQQVGTPYEVFNRPANEFVAGFIGEPPMNFLECTLTLERGEYSLRSPSLSIPCSDDLAEKLEKRSGGQPEVRVGIRPTDIEISRGESGADSIRTEVYTVEPRGDGMILTVKLGEEVVRVESVEEFDYRPGDSVWVTPEKDRIHVFDISNGETLT